MREQVSARVSDLRKQGVRVSGLGLREDRAPIRDHTEQRDGVDDSLFEMMSSFQVAILLVLV